MLEIPPNATIRKEYVKCGNPDCQNSHGPYLYAYWKHDKKLNKKYVGKNLEDFRLRKIAKEMKVRPSQFIKLKFIQQEASKDNVLAKQYLEKLRKEEVSTAKCMDECRLQANVEMKGDNVGPVY